MKRISRREFVGGAIATAGAVAAAPALLRARNLNDKLNIAIIGAGGRGAANLKGMASENIVALCDVNRAALDAAASQYPNAKRYADLRKVFDDALDFDAVVVSTCEHTHAFFDDAGARGGQARLLREAARLQHLGVAAHPREGGHGQGRDTDGHSDSRGRQLPSGRRARAERRHRPGA
jgi:Predicted dehydrogenases and related proteins